MNFVKEAYSRVICSDGRPTRIKSMNSLVKLSPAKEIYARSRRQGGEDKLCWSLSSVLSVTNCLIHSIFWLIINGGLPPAHKPTLHRHSKSRPNPCGSQTPNQASFNKNFKCRFFMNHYLWLNRRPFSLKGWAGSPALWFAIKNSTRTPLCFSPITLLSRHRQGVQGTAWKNRFPFDSVVRTRKWVFPCN